MSNLKLHRNQGSPLQIMHFCHTLLGRFSALVLHKVWTRPVEKKKYGLNMTCPKEKEGFIHDLLKKRVTPNCCHTPPCLFRSRAVAHQGLRLINIYPTRTRVNVNDVTSIEWRSHTVSKCVSLSSSWEDWDLRTFWPEKLYLNINKTGAYPPMLRPAFEK